MSFQNVNAALRKRFTDAGLFAAEAVAQENVRFDVGKKTSWAALWIMPAESRPIELGSIGQDQETGILQIDLNFPQGTGTAAAFEMADRVRTLYPVGLVVSYGGQDVTIARCARSPGRDVDNFFRVSVSVTWRAWMRRTS